MRPEDKVKLEEERRLGVEARQTLESPALRTALDDMKTATVAKWSEAAAEADRTDLWNFYRAVLCFEAALEAAVASGRFAENELSEAMGKMRRIA